MSTDTDYTAHEIAPGIILQARHDAPKDRVEQLVRECRAIALARDTAIDRIKECVTKLVEIDDDDAPGLVYVAEIIGWTACRTDATAEQYQRVILAMLDTLDDEDLLRALEVAEHALFLNGGAS